MKLVPFMYNFKLLATCCYACLHSSIRILQLSQSLDEIIHAFGMDLKELDRTSNQAHRLTLNYGTNWNEM